MPFGRYARLGLLCLAVISVEQAPAATWSDHFPRLAALADDGVEVSALVEHLETGRPLAAVDARKRLIPASVSKLYVVRAALESLGADHRFVTRLLSDGTVEDGVLRGDLIFAASGDPALSTSDLRDMVARLEVRDITRIAGDIVIDDTLFGSLSCEIKDRCEARTESAHAFDGALSAAGIDYGTVEVAIYPATQAGAPARIVVLPRGIEGFALHGAIKTGAAGSLTRIGLTRSTDEEGMHHLHLSGEIPVDHRPLRRSRSIVDPARHTGEVLRALLMRAGVRLDGAVRVLREEDDKKVLQELVRHYSDPLAAQLHTMMQYSNNYMADLLTLHVARRSAGESRLSEAADQLLTALPRDPAPEDTAPLPELDSGSGLSIGSRVSARDMVRLLRDSYQAHALFPAFLGTLPVPMYSHNGQLDYDNLDWQTRLAAKTGWLSEPVGVRSLAGYLRLKDGSWAAFAVILNGTAASPHLPRQRTLGAMRADIRELLASH